MNDRRNNTYILVDTRPGGAALGYVIDLFEAHRDDMQPAETARFYFEARGFDPEFSRIFVMLGNEPEWKP